MLFILFMENPENQSLRIDEPLYNSRIIKIFVEYLNKYHPQADIDSVLRDSWITSYELEDQGHWFSQWQVDNFYERLTKETKDKDIARKVGRYAANSEAIGALKHYALGFMNPAAAYWVLEKIANHVTRATTFKTKKLGPHRIEITVTPRPGISEKAYQCENRIGLIEAVSKLFAKKFPDIEHTACLHKGADICRYIISWEKTPSFMLRRVRNYLVLLSVLVCSAIPFFQLPGFLTILIYIFVAMIIFASFYSDYLEKEDLVRGFESQREASRLLLDQIDMRYNDAQLIKEIGQTTSMLLDIDSLSESVIQAMEKRLDFDRGGVWLANKRKTQLIYKMGYGYRPAVEEVLRKTRFRLDNPRSRGVVVLSFRQRRPFLINDISEIKQDLSKRSLEFVEKIGSQSFICVPVVYEGEPLGVLLVDNLSSKRRLDQSDMSILMGIAPQIAISIHNAMSYEQLQQSKEREQNLRELFEKYVPAPIIKRYTNSKEVDLFRGEESIITAMFLDIRGFTSSSETMDAKDVVAFLNGFFDKCSSIISEEGGHINKYTGDGFLAIFGAPEPLANHALLAFNAALKILSFSSEIYLAGKTIGLGMGLHVGKAILGNIGSQTKIEYTAVGDTVNTAARVQEFTKQFYDFPIIMSRQTWKQLAGHPEHQAIKNLGEQVVRGKKEKLEAFGFSPLMAKKGI